MDRTVERTARDDSSAPGRDVYSRSGAPAHQSHRDPVARTQDPADFAGARRGADGGVGARRYKRPPARAARNDPQRYRPADDDRQQSARRVAHQRRANRRRAQADPARPRDRGGLPPARASGRGKKHRARSPCARTTHSHLGRSDQAAVGDHQPGRQLAALHLPGRANHNRAQPRRPDRTHRSLPTPAGVSRPS